MENQKNFIMASYALQLATLAVGGTWILALIISYWTRSKTGGHWLATHCNWQIKTVWYALAGLVISLILFTPMLLGHENDATMAMILLGFLILFVDGIWFVYRNIKGIMRLSSELGMQPLPAQ